MDYLYQYCYYRYMENGADYTPASFILLMHELLEKAGIPHRTGITTKRYPGASGPAHQLQQYHLGLSIWNPTENAILHRPAMLFPVKCLPACKAKKPYWKTTHALPLPSTTPPRQPGYGYHKRFYKRHHSPHQPPGRDERCTERTLPTLPHYG